jgi:predicted Zn finger-like uncharacterized protein
MASTITITCPECGIQIKAPAGVEGKKIRCKSCGHTFTAKAAPEVVEEVEEVQEAGPAKKAAKAPAKAPAAKAPPAKAAPAKPKDKPPAKPDKAAKKPPQDEEDEDSNPYKVTALENAARCPECANEMESEDAVVCLHCGFNTQTRERARTRKIRDVTGFDMFLWLLPGIACVLAIILLITFDILYCVKIEDWIEKDVWYDFIAHYGIKIWLVIISLFGMYKAGYFAVQRLIIHNTPPEVEEKLMK